MMYIWSLIFLGLFQNSITLDCYKCEGVVSCKEKEIELITCTTTPDVTTTPKATTKKSTTTTTITTTEATTIENPEAVHDEFADDIELVSENSIETSGNRNGSSLEHHREKRYIPKGRSEDPWKCFTQKDEGKLFFSEK